MWGLLLESRLTQYYVYSVVGGAMVDVPDMKWKQYGNRYILVTGCEPVEDVRLL